QRHRGRALIEEIDASAVGDAASPAVTARAAGLTKDAGIAALAAGGSGATLDFVAADVGTDDGERDGVGEDAATDGIAAEAGTAALPAIAAAEAALAVGAALTARGVIAGHLQGSKAERQAAIAGGIDGTAIGIAAAAAGTAMTACSGSHASTAQAARAALTARRVVIRQRRGTDVHGSGAGEVQARALRLTAVAAVAAVAA